MSFIFGGEPQASRFSARRRDLASNDIFGVMASPARTAKQEVSERITDKTGNGPFSPNDYSRQVSSGRSRGQVYRNDSVAGIMGGEASVTPAAGKPSSAPRGSRVPSSPFALDPPRAAAGGVERKRADPVSAVVNDAVAHAVEAVSPGGSGGLTERDLAVVRGGPGDRGEPSVGACSVATTVDSAEPVMRLNVTEAWGASSTTSSSSPAQRGNPLFGGSVESPQRTQRRMVPAYFEKREERVRRKGSRPEVEDDAAGMTTERRGKYLDDFRPSHRLVKPPQSHELLPEDEPRHLRPAPGFAQEREAGNPILQRGADRFERPDSARSGIRTFPSRANAEQRITDDAEPERPPTARRGLRPKEGNPILGDASRDQSSTHRGVRISEQRYRDHDDVISHKFSAATNGAAQQENFKIGDSMQKLTPEERLDSLVQSRLDSQRTYVLNRAKVETSSDALRNFIYDNPSAVP